MSEGFFILRSRFGPWIALYTNARRLDAIGADGIAGSIRWVTLLVAFAAVPAAAENPKADPSAEFFKSGPIPRSRSRSMRRTSSN